ncbi:MAG: hypothetical protein ACM3PT_12765 [Deltaproteobacteria bacterium]
MNTKIYPENIKKQGWDQMNKILEKEMPVRNKRRRWIFFLLLFGILSTAGVIISDYYLGNSPVNTELKEPEIKKNNAVRHHKPIASNLNHEDETRIKSDIYNKKSVSFTRNLTDKHFYHEESVNSQDKTLISESQKMGSQKSDKIKEREKESIANISLINNELNYQRINHYLAEKNAVLFRNRVKGLWHPYIEAKLFNKESGNVKPGLEFSFGNTFNISSRMFLDLSIGYADPGLLGNSVSLEQSYNTDASTSLYLENKQERIENKLSGGLIEISMFQGYRINKRISLRGGGGITFPVLLSSKILAGNDASADKDMNVEFTDSKNNSYNFSQEGLIPAYNFFVDANAAYRISGNLSLLAGYKHYFREYNVVTDLGVQNIYRVYFNQPAAISNFYLGLRYNFIRKKYF